MQIYWTQWSSGQSVACDVQFRRTLLVRTLVQAKVLQISGGGSRSGLIAHQLSNYVLDHHRFLSYEENKFTTDKSRLVLRYSSKVIKSILYHAFPEFTLRCGMTFNKYLGRTVLCFLMVVEVALKREQCSTKLRTMQNNVKYNSVSYNSYNLFHIFEISLVCNVHFLQFLVDFILDLI